MSRYIRDTRISNRLISNPSSRRHYSVDIPTTVHLHPVIGRRGSVLIPDWLLVSSVNACRPRCHLTYTERTNIEYMGRGVLDGRSSILRVGERGRLSHRVQPHFRVCVVLYFFDIHAFT